MSDVVKVPWNSEAWERAILQRTDVGRIGCGGDWVLYTPGRLLVDSVAAQDPRVQEELKRRSATECEEPAAKIAASLGLTLFTMPDNLLADTIATLRSLVPNAASLEHIWMPGPSSFHGDDVPEPTPDPQDIPGTKAENEPQERLAIYVLDTGVAQVPFDVETDGDDAEIADEDTDSNRDPAAGHGTHVAGIIARGAPDARIVVRRVLTSPVGLVSELDTVDALRNATDGGAHLINCSFGGTTLFDAPPLATERALAQLPPEVVVVAAAGNDGMERPRWPAASKRVIAVGAVGRDEGGDWKQVDFSSWGWWVDCCAPGVKIPSTFLCWDGGDDEPVFEGFATWSGTSFAAPAVTAAIASFAMANDMPPSLAAWHVVEDPKRARVGSIGTLVV